jgi:type VI secretion system protein ImpA
VHSRSDALRALAVAREYFERHEPSNPAPLLIKRVERLAASSFLEIIEEMAPSSMDHIKMQTGLSR